MIRKPITRVEALQNKRLALIHEENNLGNEYEKAVEEFDKYIKRHKSLSFDKLETSDNRKLEQIYDYFDSRYAIKFEGGIRNDGRGMKLCRWIYEDPNYLIIHLTSTSENICFSGSTSWYVKAVGLEEKIEVLKKIKDDVKKILDNDS